MHVSLKNSAIHSSDTFEKTQDLLTAPLSLGIETTRGVWSPNWKKCKASERLPKIFWKVLFNPNTSQFGTSLLWCRLQVNLSFYEYLFIVEATMLGKSLSSLAVFNLILFVEVFIFQTQDGTSMGPLQTPKMILTWTVNHHSLSTRSQRSTQLPASEFFLETFGNTRTLFNPNASCFGKYTELELQFSDQGKLTSVKMLDYYLEWNHVTATLTPTR